MKMRSWWWRVGWRLEGDWGLPLLNLAFVYWEMRMGERMAEPHVEQNRNSKLVPKLILPVHKEGSYGLALAWGEGSRYHRDENVV